MYTAISIAITIGFNADVNAQAGAYATGILAMMVSGSIAVTISALRKKQRRACIGFTVLTVVMLYALAANVIEKPDGITISVFFILGIIAVSLVSRVSRTTELRVDSIEFDETARRFITDTLAFDGRINLIANRPHTRTSAEYAAKEAAQRQNNPVPDSADVIFLEIDITDPSEFSEVLTVRGVEVARTRTLNGQRAIPWSTSCVTCSSDAATRPPWSGKSSEKTKPTPTSGQASTSGELYQKQAEEQRRQHQWARGGRNCRLQGWYGIALYTNVGT